MTIFIYGGSNSLLKTGWTATLARKMTDEPMVNLSIGGTTSITAIYRMLSHTETEHRPDDVVVWEYALNEVNHINKGFEPEVALKNAERFIRECTRRGLKFVATIFTPLEQEAAPERLPFFDQLNALMQHYGIATFDVSSAWRSKHSVRRVPKKLYRNNAHYANDPEILDFIADGVSDAIRQASVPLEASPLRCGRAKLHVELVENGEPFENSKVKCMVAPLPYAFSPSQVGKIIGIACLIHPESKSALQIVLSNNDYSGRWINLSTAGTPTVEKVILKVFALEAATGDGWQTRLGDQVEVQSLEQSASLYGESLTRQKLGHPDEDPKPAFIGLVLELDETQ